eukprot:6195233-Prymnesium_polylepis.1
MLQSRSVDVCGSHDHAAASIEPGSTPWCEPFTFHAPADHHGTRQPVIERVIRARVSSESAGSVRGPPLVKTVR